MIACWLKTKKVFDEEDLIKTVQSTGSVPGECSGASRVAMPTTACVPRCLTGQNICQMWRPSV